MKICTKCSIEKDESEFYLRKENGKLRNECKKCFNIAVGIRFQKDKQRKKAKQKEWYIKNKDTVIKKHQRCYEANPSIYQAAKVRWKKKNPDKIKANGQSHIDNLANCYVRTKLKRQGFSPDIITPDVIESKKILIKIHRHVKNKQKTDN